MKSMTLLLTLAFILPLAACQGPDTAPKDPVAQQPATIKPGQNLSGIHDLSLIRGPGVDASEDGPHPAPPYSVCGLAAVSDAVVIAEITGPGEIYRLPSDCSGPYSWTHRKYPVRILANAAGDEVPTEMELRFVGYPLPFDQWDISTGDILLTSVRAARDDWFGSRPMLVNFEREGLNLSTGKVDIAKTDIPTTFEGLSEEISRAKADMEGVCPTFVPLLETDEEYASRHFDPLSNGCEPWDDTPQTPGSGGPVIEEENCPPEGCMDE